MSIDSILQWISTYLIHLLFLFIVLYACWQGIYAKLRLNSWFREDGYEKVSGDVLSDQIGNTPCWQFISRRRRTHSFLRKKNTKRTQYNVTILKLSDVPPQDFYFLIRPRRVLDALEYALVVSDISFEDWGTFGEHYLVETNDGDQLYQRIGSPMRQLLLDVEGLSLELIGQYLILMRVNQFFDQREHLQTERESADLLATYLFGQQSSEMVVGGDKP